MYEIFLPLYLFHSFSDIFNKSFLSKNIFPFILALSGFIPINNLESIVFPEPLSPMIMRVSPFGNVNEMSFSIVLLSILTFSAFIFNFSIIF